jgi:putative membrane protein
MIAAVATSPLVPAHMWWDGGWGIAWGLVMAAFWIAVIAGLVILLRAVARGSGGPGGQSALKVLEERYARGEITRDEFLERRAVLTDTGTPREA